MGEVPSKEKVAILRVLRDANGPLGSARIARAIQVCGFDVSARTVRVHLEQMAAQGLVAAARRGRSGGRSITPQGVREIGDALVQDRVGLTAVRMDTLAWQMTFDVSTRTGCIVLNITTVDESDFVEAVARMIPVFEAGLGMGEYLAIFQPGDEVGRLRVPAGKIGIGTVCSVTINGILLSARIPTVSRFGGVLELAQGKPVRFTDVIYYDGSSLDPLEIFIKGGLTQVGAAATMGQGRIGVSFREVPSHALERVEKAVKQLERIGLGGVLLLGRPNQPLLGFPVPDGRTAMLVAGGLNPAAAVEEAGLPTTSFALSHLYEFERLTHYRDVARQTGVLVRGWRGSPRSAADGPGAE